MNDRKEIIGMEEVIGMEEIIGMEEVKRPIRKIIVHCSATEEGQFFTAAHIDRWHRHRGWSGIGYHFVVLIDGTVERGRPLHLVGAHCKGHNFDSIGVVYIGGLRHGLPADTRTEEQKVALWRLLRDLKNRFPNVEIGGHHDWDVHKACPCFDARSEYRGL